MNFGSVFNRGHATVGQPLVFWATFRALCIWIYIEKSDTFLLEYTIERPPLQPELKVFKKTNFGSMKIIFLYFESIFLNEN